MTDSTPNSETPEQIAHEARYSLANEFGGYDLRSAVKVHWKSATFTTWTDAIAELAQGITVTVPCSTPRADGSGHHTHHKHTARFNPDGTVTLLHHPSYEANPEAELVLAALGNHMCACLALTIHVPARRLVPTSVINHNAINVRLRALHAAVQWAQHPDTVWTPDFGDAYLRFGVTPSVMDEWTADGWAHETALRFQQTYTTLDLANQWRAAGDLTLRAATVAGRGESPNAEAQWAAVGFTPARSVRWRTGGYSPETAYEWDRHNIAPTMARVFNRDLSATTSPTLDQIKEWCAAGIPCTKATAWYRKTGGDLAYALRWARAGLSPTDVTNISQWNATNPHCPVLFERVAEFKKARFPVQNVEIVAAVIDSGYTPEQWHESMTRLVEGSHPALLEALIEHDIERVEQGIYSWGYADPDPDRVAGSLRALRGYYASGEVGRFIATFETRNPSAPH